MPLQRGKVLGYDFNRMVVDFTMFNQGKTVRCAISTAAMDDLEGKHEVRKLPALTCSRLCVPAVNMSCV